MPNESHSTEQVAHPAVAEAFRFWLKLGFISFGAAVIRIGRKALKNELM